MHRMAMLIALTGYACKAPLPPDLTPPPTHFAQTGSLEGAVALAEGSGRHVWVALEHDFALRESPGAPFSFISRGDLPPGQVTFLGTIDGSREWLFAHVHGAGFFRNWANSSTWTPVNGLTSPTLDVLQAGLRPVPMDMATAADGVTWLASLGGLYYTADEGQTWQRADTTSSGDANIVFTGVDARRNRVAAVAMLPDGLIPDSFGGVLSGTVFVSDNNGLTWRTPDEAFPSSHATSVAVADDGTVFVGTMDDGVYRGSGDGDWTALFGPSDVTDVEWVDGGLSVASATRGLWRLDGESWSQAGTGAVVGLADQLGVTRDGRVFELVEGPGDPPPSPAGGQVHVALSMHADFYHSDRRDDDDEGGYGRDIRVMTAALEWLAEHPDARVEWVFESARTLEERLPEDSPELLAAIQQRVATGADRVRLTGWSNAPFTALSQGDLERSLAFARDAVDEAFGAQSDGLHPPEGALAPDTIGRLRDAGIEWISLFYGANGYTGTRNFVRLDGASAHNPYLLTDATTQRSIAVIPVYHHGDLLDHGGLAGWVKQLSAAHEEDTLLVIHFDAGAESWENFGVELSRLADLPNVQFTTPGEYLNLHPPLQDFVLTGEVTNGVRAGLASWSERPINHSVSATLAHALQLTRAAELLAPDDPATAAAAAGARAGRLEALTADNFGMTAPSLHPDRELAARQQADAVADDARVAWSIAREVDPLGPQQLAVVNPLAAGGRAWATVHFTMPAGAWEGEAGLTIARVNGGPLPFLARRVATDDQFDHIEAQVRLTSLASSIAPLVWSYDPAEDDHPRGGIGQNDTAGPGALGPPYVDCGDRRVVATSGLSSVAVDPWGLSATRTETWTLPSCLGGVTEVQRRITALHDTPGLVVEVEASIDPAADAGSMRAIALAPLSCPQGVQALRWPTHGGEVYERPVPEGAQAFNGVSADGWVEATCGDGSRLQLALDQRVATAFGPLSVRDDDVNGTIAPLAALWAPAPWHDASRTGGLGVADLVTPLIGGQFRPTAPDWAGEQVRMRLWVTTNTSDDELTLFAKPPVGYGP